MTPNNRPDRKSDRTITYRVGWKRGTIRLAAGKGSVRLSLYRLWSSCLERIVWREAPFLTGSSLVWTLWILTGIAFICSVALVYMLGNAPQV